MQITTRVIDRQTGQPLGYASVTFVDAKGDFIPGTGDMAAEDGTISLNSELLDRQDVFIEISAVGYDTESFSPEELMEGDVKMWPKKSNTLGEVKFVSTVKKKLDQRTGGYGVPVALAALSVVSLSIWAWKTWM